MTGVKRSWPEEIQNVAILHRVFIELFITLFFFYFFLFLFWLFPVDISSASIQSRTKSKSRTFEKYCRELKTTELQAYFSSAKLQPSIRFITI